MATQLKIMSFNMRYDTPADGTTYISDHNPIYIIAEI